MAMNDHTDGLGAFGRKLQRFVPTPAEQMLLTEFSKGRRRIPAGEELANPDRIQEFTYILHEGWACTFRELHDGNRHIIDFRLPGDFMGLLSLLLHKVDYTVVALSDVVVSEISTAKLVSTFRQSPLLAEGVLWSLSRDTAIMAEHLVNVGRRGATARVAHLLLELGHRLNQVGHAEPDSFTCPLTQKDLAEALGITPVHLNRVLRQLRKHRLVSFTDHTVTLHDMRGLMRIADFESSYLDHR